MPVKVEMKKEYDKNEGILIRKSKYITKKRK